MKTTITRRSFLRAVAATAIAPSLLPSPTQDPIHRMATDILAFFPAEHFTMKSERDYGPGFKVYVDILYGIKKAPYGLVGEVTA